MLGTKNSPSTITGVGWGNQLFLLLKKTASEFGKETGFSLPRQLESFGESGVEKVSY